MNDVLRLNVKGLILMSNNINIKLFNRTNNFNIKITLFYTILYTHLDSF